MTVEADLATLYLCLDDDDYEGKGAHNRVEAEIARLREERDAALDREAGMSDAFDAMKADRDEYDAILGRKMAERDAAEARLGEAHRECARLQQALAFYADPSTYEESAEPDPERFATGVIPIRDDEGGRAREALAGPDTPADRPIFDAPYGQTINGHSAVIVLTEEQIDLILHEFRDVSIVETLACSVKDELRRAKTALARDRADSQEDKT